MFRISALLCSDRVRLLPIICLVTLVGLMSSTSGASGAPQVVPAFPGAEGYGANSVGGRGGRVIEVTNLNDDGPGSLRDCAQRASEPRICVFRVGGIIDLQSRLRVKYPYLTIAGQTAPGGGILLKNRGISLAEGVHDVTIRYLRIRYGDTSKTGGQGQVNIGIDWSSNNIIVDHVSTSWTLDENTTIYLNRPTGATEPRPPIYNITFQNLLIAEGLWDHSTGISISGEKDDSVSPPIEDYKEVYDISLHHNLFAHNSFQGGI